MTKQKLPFYASDHLGQIYSYMVPYSVTTCIDKLLEESVQNIRWARGQLKLSIERRQSSPPNHQYTIKGRAGNKIVVACGKLRPIDDQHTQVDIDAHRRYGGILGMSLMLIIIWAIVGMRNLGSATLIATAIWWAMMGTALYWGWRLGGQRLNKMTNLILTALSPNQYKPKHKQIVDRSNDGELMDIDAAQTEVR